MNKEQQIEEMTKDLCDTECKGLKCNICDSYGCEYRMQAEALHNAGYRKVVFCKDCVYNKNGGCMHIEIWEEQNYNPEYFCADGLRSEDNE